MSRYARYSTPLKDRERIVQALQEMGYEVLSNAPLCGWEGEGARANLVARRQGRYDVGLFLRPDGSYDVEADWMNTGITREAFVEGVQNRLAAQAVVAGIRKGGGRRIEQVIEGDEIVIRAFVPA